MKYQMCSTIMLLSNSISTVLVEFERIEETVVTCYIMFGAFNFSIIFWPVLNTLYKITHCSENLFMFLFLQWLWLWTVPHSGQSLLCWLLVWSRFTTSRLPSWTKLWVPHWVCACPQFCRHILLCPTISYITLIIPKILSITSHKITYFLHGPKL